MVDSQYYLQLSQGQSYPYTIVRSSRAKYIRVKLSNTGQLSVVVPKRLAIKHGQAFIKNKVTWIEKHLKNISFSTEVLPKTLNLQLLGEKWSIVYLPKDCEHLYLKERDDFCLNVVGNTDNNKELVKKLLNKWCQHKARSVYVEMLDDIAAEYSFHFNRLSIRSQKTRWGSCSQKKNINLNSKLLFFKESIVRYVMIHELCHTIEMNHSKRFWALVKKCDPDYLSNQAQLKSFAREIVL